MVLDGLQNSRISATTPHDSDEFQCFSSMTRPADKSMAEDPVRYMHRIPKHGFDVRPGLLEEQ